MRTYASLFLIMLLLSSCDDGDIIVTTFEFEDETFSMCSDQRNKVLYHINNDNVYETLTVQISSSSFSPEDGQLLRAPQAFTLPLNTNNVAPIRIPLTGNNEIIYRTYDGPIPSDYFCRNIPPSSPRVLQEYRSVGGEVIINTTINYNAPSTGLDHDGDGIPSSQEGRDILRDTDGDGIPDYLDIDDDGDNVPTSTERTDWIDEDPTAVGYPDTDGDGIPNYLDPDDDGDGIMTRREVTEENPNPVNNWNEERNLRRYLDEDFAVRYNGEISFSLPNNISVRFSSEIEVRNLKLKNQGGDGEEISFISKGLGNFTSGQAQVQIGGGQIPDENGDEDDNEEDGDGTN